MGKWDHSINFSIKTNNTLIRFKVTYFDVLKPELLIKIDELILQKKA